MGKFKVNDRVVLLTPKCCDELSAGTLGTVDSIDGIIITVLWDNFTGGYMHMDKRKWVVSADEIALADENIISSHYQTRIQPIETMQANMSPEEFQGFCKGNIIKYACRCGKKDAPLKEAEKILQYAKWLVCSLKGEIINPHREGGVKNSSSKEKT